MPYRKVRPMPHEKAARNEMIYEMYQKNPNMTYGDIAKNFDLSWQRIQQIVKRAKKEREASQESHETQLATA